MTRYIRIRLSDGKPRFLTYSNALRLAREARAANMTLWWYLELGEDLNHNEPIKL